MNNLNTILEELQNKFVEYEISLSHGKNSILIYDQEHGIYGVFGQSDDGTYHLSDGGSLFPYLTDDGYFLPNDISEKMINYLAELPQTDDIILKVDDTFLSLCIYNIYEGDIEKVWNKYSSLYSDIASFKEYYD